MIEKKIVEALTAAGETVAFCESLTAGLATAALAKVPGASAVLRGGLVTYSTDLKHTLAGVPRELLASHGPVAAETAEAMAVGARSACGSDWAVSLTGVAGPQEQDGHPVGEAFIGIARPDGSTTSVHAVSRSGSRYSLSPHASEPVPVLLGDRDEIRRAAVESALEHLLTEMTRWEPGTKTNLETLD